MSHRNYRMEPILDETNKILGYEMLTTLPPEIQFHSLTKVVKKNILFEQLEIAEHLQSELLDSDAFISVNIDDDLLKLLLKNEILLNRLRKNTSLRLELNENIKITEKECIRLFEACKGIKLWLDDYAPKNKGLYFAIKNNLVEVVKIEKDFFWEHGGTVFFEQLIKELHSFNLRIVCEGVDTIERKKYLDKIRVWGRQGFLYPARVISCPHDSLNNK